MILKVVHKIEILVNRRRVRTLFFECRRAAIARLAASATGAANKYRLSSEYHRLGYTEHTNELPGRYTVAVKVIDIFGNDTMTLVPVNVA